MDGNKDEALKCFAIGKKALSAGDRPRALKFLAKARRLDPSLAVDDLPGNTPSSVAPNAPYAAKAKAKASLDGPSRSKAYTDEQIMIVRQIKKQKDYYQILGVKRECTVEDVRKAYRKLSLKVHPDKNQAPGAEEAFKAVSKAFQCLNNNESRKKYDVVGSEETDYGRPAAQHRHASSGFYRGDVDAEEIFRNFFYNGGAPVGVPFGSSGFRAGPSFNGVHVSDGFDVRSLLKMLPFIVLLLVNVLPAFLSSSGPVYMLSRSYRYNYSVETPRGVPYYVKSAKYEEDFPPESYDRITVEQKVDREYFGILRQNCRAEMQRRQWDVSNHMPHCKLLQKFQDTTG